ncbi:MAG: hypothetical protein HYT80_00500 [Euryarchaeota archaeon]|nr:hypothetical protein [Euryarchaeota archaeon]
MTAALPRRAAVALYLGPGTTWTAGVAFERAPGYVPTSARFPNEESAHAFCDRINQRWGLTPKDAYEIIATTMRRPRPPHVVVEVRGGCVTDVYCLERASGRRAEIEHTVRDFDNIRQGDPDPLADLEVNA